MEGRMTITNMAIEAGATSGMMMVDKNTIDYFFPAFAKKYKKGVSRKEMLTDLKRWNSDADAQYAQVVNIDVTKLVPVMTNNYSPDDVVPVAKLAGKQINQTYIGSCTNGRLEDLRIAASIFRQTRGKVAAGHRCVIVPATQYIYERALQEGLLDVFVKAGCFVSGPTCGACLGMSCGVMAPGEVCVSTTNRNFPGRMGKDSMVHLSSPATAALSAIAGKIVEPTIKAAKRAISDCMKAAAKGKPVQLTDWKDKPVKKPDYATLLGRIGGGQAKDFSGKPFYLPADNIDTDQIIPAKYLTETQKEIFGKHCLEDAPISAADRPRLYQSQILVAGDNFGCGSSREHAPWALEGAGIRCIIAMSFARIFENNMFANGLLCITLPKDVIAGLHRDKPTAMTIDLQTAKLSWSGGQPISFNLSEYQKDLIKNNGSVGIMLKLAAELQAEKKI
jgi:3-isopropylmalate dehydratase small subunit